tara:strand:+ start:2766 stop:3215 length:450 start_codon:yes stop_codon:yes gene_type:complete
MTSEKIKEIINERVNIDLTANTRERKHVYARSIYYKLCRELTKMKLHEIAATVNRNHASVLHGINNVFKIIKEYNDPMYEIYLDLTEKEMLPLRQKYEILTHKYNELSQYIFDDQYKSIYNLIQTIPKTEIKNVEVRLSAIIDILNKKN